MDVQGMHEQGSDDQGVDEQSTPSSDSAGTAPRGGTTRRRLLIGAAGGAALLAAGGAGWWAATRRDSRTPGPDQPCLASRELPGTLPTELRASGELALEAEDLGAVFRLVSVQDVARVPVTDGPERILLTQHGADAQIQFVAADGSVDPITFDAEFGVNPGVAVSEDGTSYFVTREEGRVLTVDAGLTELRDLGRVSEEATSLYSPVIGSGGTVFGGSYPTAAIWALEPSSGEIRIGPRIGENQYVRSLAVSGDRVFAGTGGDEPMLIEVDLTELTPLAQHAVPAARAGGSISRLVTLADARLLVYRDEEDGGADGIIFDPADGSFAEELAPGASSRSLAREGDEGAMVYVAAESIMRWTPGSEPEEVGPSPVANPAAVVELSDGTVIAVVADPEGRAMLRVAPISPAGEARDLAVIASGHDITAVVPMPSTGHLAIGGYQGDGLVVLDPVAGTSAHARRGTGIQQVEGGVESGTGAVVVGSYGEGRVHEATIADGEDVLAVAQVDDLGEEFEQARPIAWGQLSDGGLVVGTVPEQGREGGLVQTFRRTDERLGPGPVLMDPAEGLSIVGVLECAPGEVVVTTSVRGGYGTQAEGSESRVLRIAIEDGTVLWDSVVPVADSYTPIIQQGQVLCATTSGMIALDLEDGSLLAKIDIGPAADAAGYTSARIEPWQAEGRFLHAARGRLSVLDIVDGTVTTGSDPVGSPLAVLHGQVYAASGSSLVRFALPESTEVGACASPAPPDG